MATKKKPKKVTIKAPNPEFMGRRNTVAFIDGVASIEVEDTPEARALLGWFERHGYEVTDGAASDDDSDES